MSDASAPSASAGEPELSVCVPTDTFATVGPVFARLCAQTIARSIELVLPTPDPEALSRALPADPQLAGVRVVGVDALVPLGRARAAGVRAATAPFVFLGETHSFADPAWAEALLARHREGWAVVVPGISNANPKGALSWAGLLLDYGGWIAERAPGEIDYWPLNNSSCRRSALLEFADLERGLSYGDQLLVAMRASGHRVYFEPKAGLAHVNVARPGAWLDERWVGGVLVARHRARDWPLAKRFAYVLGSPLIPLVLLGRVAGTAWEVVRRRRLPLSVLPLMVAGSVAHGLGETVGYAGVGTGEGAEARMTEYEVHKLRYARAGG